MKAWTHTSAGLFSKVLTQSSLPKPAIVSPIQVVVKVSHCALNPAGSIVMQLLPSLLRATPAIPEMDFAGIVVDSGTEVPESRNIKPGVEVFGSIPV